MVCLLKKIILIDNILMLDEVCQGHSTYKTISIIGWIFSYDFQKKISNFNMK